VITVNFYAAAKASVGTSTLYVESNSIKNIINKLSLDYPKIVKIIPSCTFILDGLATQDLEQFINEGSNLDILPKFAGG